MVVFFENTHPKRRALMQMYIVVPITKKREYKGNHTKSPPWIIDYLFID